METVIISKEEYEKLKIQANIDLDLLKLIRFAYKLFNPLEIR